MKLLAFKSLVVVGSALTALVNALPAQDNGSFENSQQSVPLASVYSTCVKVSCEPTAVLNSYLDFECNPLYAVYSPIRSLSLSTTVHGSTFVMSLMFSPTLRSKVGLYSFSEFSIRSRVAKAFSDTASKSKIESQKPYLTRHILLEW